MADPQPWDEVVRSRIEAKMHNRLIGNDDFSIITSENLGNVWETSAVQSKEMQHAIRGQNEEASWLFDDCIKVISIFVMIHTSDWSHIGELLNEGLKDSCLPITLSQLDCCWFASLKNKSAVAKKFHAQQYAFCPATIKERRHVRCEDRHTRLPIVEESDSLGTGSYGTVTKVKIAGGYIMETHTGVEVLRTKETIAARKRFRVAINGRIEYDVLDRLDKDRWQNSCIMSSFASVSLGSFDTGECEFNLFFPYAPADLWKFLEEADDSHQLLGLTTPDKITPRALFSEVLDLVDALKFLHREDLRMCHSDLKLDNILIVSCDGHPIGKWKITDFGIASIQLREPSDPQGWGDVVSMKYATRASKRFSGLVTNTDQREKGPYQPPEVENSNLIPPGAMYRAKGDIWSLGCISVHVFLYALGGKTLATDLRNILHASSREPGRGGYFYDLMPNDTATLYVDMSSWIEKLAISWDERASQPSSRFHSWAHNVWSKLIIPMLTPAVTERPTADVLFKQTEVIIKDYTPSENIWGLDAWQDATLNRPDKEAYGGITSMSGAFPDVPARSNLPLRSGTGPWPSVLTTGRSRTTGRRQQRHVDKLQVPPTLEETGEPSGSTSRSSIRSRSIAVATPRSDISPSPKPLISTPTTCDLKSWIGENPSAVQVTDNGARVFFLIASGVISFIRSSSRSDFWTPGDTSYINEGYNTVWHSLHLADPYLCLRTATTLESESYLRLYHQSTQRDSYQREWDSNVVKNLATMTLVTISSKGHIAFRTEQKTAFELYDSTAKKILSWNLESDTSPPTAETRGNIEAIAFDPTGEYLVVTAYDCWYVWQINALEEDKLPIRSGNHDYTPREVVKSQCSLQVFQGGKYFLLHDHCQRELCITVDTHNNRVQQHHLGGIPKPHTITVSTTGDWLAYVERHRWSRDRLHYHQLRVGEPGGNGAVSLGPVQTRELDRIKTVTVGIKPVVDSVVRIVTSETEPYAVVASIAKVVELVPLHITTTAPTKKKWF